MSFLPQEFSGSDERSGAAELPSDNVSPLVKLQWEISVTGDPFAVGVVHNGLTGGSDSNRFGQVSVAVFSDPSDFS